MAQTPEFKEWHSKEVRERLGVTEEVIKRSNTARGFAARYTRTYDFPDRVVKDHDTGHERHDIENVLAGDIDSFIQARLTA